MTTASLTGLAADAGRGAAGQHRHAVPPADRDRGQHVVGVTGCTTPSGTCR